ESVRTADSSLDIRFVRGPEYFRKGLAPVLDAGQSTRSRSKSRCSVNQLYRIILDTARAPPIFHPSSGLLLEEALHRAFDRLEVSFYAKVSLVCTCSHLDLPL
ncbi:hypothetical protein BD324DRAFT_585227, partial [Kockovaella imperatae]